MLRSGNTRAITALLTMMLIVAGACSNHGDSQAHGERTIDVTMTDNKFVPSEYQVRKGETVTFRFRNDGTAVHEAVIGSQAEQDSHHSEMAAAQAGTTMKSHATAGSTGSTTAPSTTAQAGHADGDAGHGGSGANKVKVDPGRTGELTYTFADTGTLIIGCHEPGHWESGMKASVVVT